MSESATAVTPMTGMSGGAGSEILREVSRRAEHLLEALKVMFADAAWAPSRLGQAANLLTGDGELGSVWFVLGGFAFLVVAGLGAASAAKALLRPVRRRLAAARPQQASAWTILLLRAALIETTPPLVFAAVMATLGPALFGAKGMIFAGTDIFRATAAAVLSDAAIAWGVAKVVTLPFAPRRPHLRLLPIGDAEAVWGARVVRRLIFIGAGSWIVAEALYMTWVGHGIARLVVIAGTVATAVYALDALARMRPRLTGFARLWNRIAALSVFGLGIAWVIGLLLDIEAHFGKVLATLAILAALPLADGMLLVLYRSLVRRFAGVPRRTRAVFMPSGTDEAEEMRRVEQPIDEAEHAAAEAELERTQDDFAGVLHEASCIALAVVAVLLLGKTWSLDLIGMLGPDDARAFLGRIFDALVTLAVGWYAWRLFEAALAMKLSREGGNVPAAVGHEGEEGGGVVVQSRARTVQPLLRAVGRLVIGATALMGALSSLGVNIAPLLASAGVVGIAVGFGAQTLVKDLFSGACYLIEDVFRIGDYIEAGTAKGTVERITFRTVALRHQNGPLHFVPYGSLGSVRNNSRDWVIDKFEIPLPSNVESERIRKMVKKIGQEMLEDAALAANIMAPLKVKLYRIDPGVKVFRCKVQTPPGKQFEVRADALRRIEAALRAADIPFAEQGARVTVNASLAPAPEPLPAVARAAE